MARSPSWYKCIFANILQFRNLIVITIIDSNLATFFQALTFKENPSRSFQIHSEQSKENGTFCKLVLREYGCVFTLFQYSSLPNERTGPNKRTGWNFDKNQISVQGGILIKILEYRVKTGNFIDNKKDF